MNLLNLIFIIIFFVIYKIETGKIRPNFDEIFGEGWKKNEIEEKREESGSETIDQIQNDQNVIRSDQKRKTDPNDQQKRKIIQKFEAIKEKLKQKRKFQWKNRGKIERKIGQLLGTNRSKIYKWKKELNLNKIKMKNSFYGEKKKEFIERFDEFKELYGQGKQKEFMKELGIGEKLFIKWKKELVPNYNKKHFTNENKLKKLKQYFEMKKGNPKIRDEIIAKKLGIGLSTLKTWKKKFSSVLKSDFL